MSLIYCSISNGDLGMRNGLRMEKEICISGRNRMEIVRFSRIKDTVAEGRSSKAKKATKKHDNSLYLSKLKILTIIY